MAQIRSTRNYEKFTNHEINRQVEKTKWLKESMQKYGWIDAFPMLAVVNGGTKLKIKAGHHRFSAARELQIPVKYVICDDDITIHELEKATVQWSLKDYMDSFIHAGISDYIKVREYHEKTGIPITLTISLLGGQSAGSNNLTRSFKDGGYKVCTDQSHAKKVAYIVSTLKDIGIEFATKSPFVSALSKVLRVKDFNQTHFLKRVKSRKSDFENQSSAAAYLGLIESTYNYKLSPMNKLPLGLLAEQEAKKRGMANLYKKEAA